MDGLAGYLDFLSCAWNEADMATPLVPRFFLYGEAPRAVGDRFLHYEALDDRTRPNNWNIRPHAHGNLNHIFHITEGGGEMQADGVVTAFEAPCLLLIPAGVVHGFTYETETSGSVLTISEPYLRELVRRETDFRRLFTTPAAVPDGHGEVVADAVARLARELAWSAPGHAAAVEALLVTLLVETLRLSHAMGGEADISPGAAGALTARFRELVEARYRTGLGIEGYAEALAVNPKRLRSACLAAAGATPLRIIQDRLMLEAKRLMLYSNMTVAETGYYLGFSDPAYFSRFFARGSGSSPRAFRARKDEAAA
jgi:AraC family transcriptional activator of pobA